MSDLPEGWTVAKVGVVITLNPKNKCDDDVDVGFIPLHLMGVRYRDVPAFEVRKWAEVKRDTRTSRTTMFWLQGLRPASRMERLESFDACRTGLALVAPNTMYAGQYLESSFLNISLPISRHVNS